MAVDRTIQLRASAGHRDGFPVPAWTRTETWVLAGILLVAAGMRLAAAGAIPSPLESDYLVYWNYAVSLAEGRGIVRPDGTPTAHHSIGYPIVLGALFAAFGASIAVVKALNVVLGVASVLFGYLSARRIFGSPEAAALGALILAVYLEASVYYAYAAKENLMIFLLMAQLVLASHAGEEGAARFWNPALFGVATGWLIVTGNAAIAFLPGFIAITFFAQGADPARTARYMLIAGMAGLLTVAPVLVRNHLAFGGWSVNTNGGFNLYIGNNPDATAYHMNIEDTPMGPYWQGLIRDLGERGAANHLGEIAMRHMIENPGRTLRLALEKAVAFWEPPTHAGLRDEGPVALLARRLWLVQYIGIALLCVAALFRIRDQWRPIGSILLMAAGYTAVHMVFYVIYRYRLPIMPMLCLLAGLGACTLLGRMGVLTAGSARPAS